MLYKIFLPILALVALGFAGRHVVVGDQEPPKLPPPVEPARSPFAGAVAGAGVIEPLTENISVGSPLPGVVVEVFARVGDEVAAGQKLFRLDDRQPRAERDVRRAMLESANVTLSKLRAMPRPEELPISEARLREAQAGLADAREQFTRADRGYRTVAVSEDERFRRKNAVATAEAQVARAEAELKLLREGAWKPDLTVAEAQVAMAESQLRQAETELDRLVVRAPVRGRVLQKNVREGEYVGVPPGQPLMVLGDVTTLHVRMDVDETDIGRFRADLPGRAVTRGANKRELSLRFVRVDPFVVPKRSLTGLGSERVDTRVLQVIYAVDGSDPGLQVGQQVDVYLDAGR
ncbi:MAG TPA: HlyD family efflux transporter periplasmic adaptor subunit [Gemmataceae bacterium]|nr:HlyD family efflux transporter periplasmic adaptor subunit [Gemmataceae bacterium]